MVATGDKAAGTDVVRSMAERAGATITEVEGSHVIMVSQPEAVADVILTAACRRRPAGRRRSDASAMESPRLMADLPVEVTLPSFAGATGWLNSQPLTAADLRGKVVLVDFWTYTCINWLRTLRYVRAWAEKYGDHGLVVIGVHTPEFPFERNLDNVRQAAKDMRVDVSDRARQRLCGLARLRQPVLAGDVLRRRAKGGSGTTSSARGNTTVGDVIQQLLGEAGREGFGDDRVVAVDPRARKSPPIGEPGSGDLPRLRANRELRVTRWARPDERTRLRHPRQRLRRNHWALSGDWTVGRRPSC